MTGGGTTTKAFSVTINPAAVAGGITVMPAEGAVDVPVNTVVSGTLTGTGDIASIFNAQTFTLQVNGAATDTISSASPDDRCVDDGIVKGRDFVQRVEHGGNVHPDLPAHERHGLHRDNRLLHGRPLRGGDVRVHDHRRHPRHGR